MIVYSVKDVLNGPRSIQAQALIRTAREVARKRAREVPVVRKFQPSSVKEGRVIHMFFKSAQSPPGIRARSSGNTRIGTPEERCPACQDITPLCQGNSIYFFAKRLTPMLY